MESSFFDDLLKRDVDQNAVNAIVGSLQSQVTSVSSSGNKVTASSAQASNAVAKDGAKTAAARVSDSPAINHIQASSRPASVNGSTSSAESVAASISQVKSAASSRSSTPNKQSPSPIITANVSSQQVNIAPKNMSSTVPIAPRIVLTHQQAQMLIDQSFAGTTLVPSNLVGNVRMAGAPVPLVPRMAGGPNAVTAVSGINMMTGQIPGMQNIVSRMQATQPVILAQNMKQEPSISTSPGTSPKPNNLAMQQAQTAATSIGLQSTTLTQVKGTSPVPGVVTYRFRQVNPGAMAANTNANNLAIMKESVKKLKEFFQNLISLACGPNQPPEIGRSVKELVQNVMYNKMNEEEFVEKLQLTLKSDPQPNLVPFLKKTLPHLRETMKQQNKVQTSQPVQQVTKAQDNLQKIAPNATQAQLPKNQVASTINLAGNQKLLPNAIQATVMQMNNNAPRQLTPSQHMLLSRSIALQQQRQQQQQQQLQKQIIQDDRVITNPSGGKDIATVMKANFQAHAQGLAAASAAHGEKSKHKAAFHYSSAMTSNDDDINDVTCMAGVNLMEESAKILSTGSELLGVQTRSCKDETFLSTEPLKRKIESIIKKHHVREVNQDVVSIVSHATEERLRNIVERLAVLSLHRVEAHREHPSFEIVSDVKSQLRVFEQIDEVERKHREAREREMLMRVAKSRSRTEDPEQARLKEKAKQLQQEEEELLRKRAANKTALEAIGPRKKRKLLDEALESLSTSYASDASGNSEGASSLQPIRLRTRRITLRDLQLILEQDNNSSKSSLLFKSYLR